MKRIAHINNGKITNISIWQDADAPASKSYLDVTDTLANIGDAVDSKGKITAQAKPEPVTPPITSDIQNLQEQIDQLKQQIAKLTKGA